MDYSIYNKKEAQERLKHELDFVTYEKKHGESRFTMFFQNHYLPEKFGYDKRKPHLSALILSGQITRDEAMEILSEPLYSDQELLKDMKFIASKLDYSLEELKNIISLPGKSYSEYKNWDFKLKWLKKIKSFLNNSLGIETKTYH